MLRHVVIAQLKDETSPEQIDEVMRQIRRLRDEIQVIKDCEVGAAADRSSLGVIITFDDAGGFQVFRDHPAHRAVAQTHLMPITSSASSVQFEV